MTETLLDVKGLNCPLPILKARKALRDVRIGEALRVLSTDPLAAQDFEDFCRATGHELVESNRRNGIVDVLIRRSL